MPNAPGPGKAPSTEAGPGPLGPVHRRTRSLVRTSNRMSTNPSSEADRSAARGPVEAETPIVDAADSAVAAPTVPAPAPDACRGAASTPPPSLGALYEGADMDNVPLVSVLRMGWTGVSCPGEDGAKFKARAKRRQAVHKARKSGPGRTQRV